MNYGKRIGNQATIFGHYQRAWWLDMDKLPGPYNTPEEELELQEERKREEKIWERQDWNGREKQFISLLRGGKNFSEVAMKMGVSPAAVAKLFGKIVKKAQGPEQLALF